MPQNGRQISDDDQMKEVRLHFHHATKQGASHRVRAFEDEYYDLMKRALPSIRKHGGITKFGVRMLARKLAKSAKLSGKVMTKRDKIAIKNFIADRYLKDSKGVSEDEKNAGLQHALTDDQKKANIKKSRRITKALRAVSGAGDNDQSFSSGRGFAAKSGETKRDVAVRRMNQGGAASASDMQFLGEKPSVSVSPSKEFEKAGFAGKLQEKSTGFAGQGNKSSNITKARGGIASGIGSTPGGRGPIRL